MQGGGALESDYVGTTEDFVRFRSVRRCFGSNTVLSKIDWSLPASSDITAIVGRSGSGKTTFLNLLGLLDTPDAGEIYIAGARLQYENRTEIENLRRIYFGFVFQNFCVVEGLSVLDNVAMPLLYRGMLRCEAFDRGMDALNQVGLAERHLDRPNILSGGEKQRVAIARAIAAEPRIILADEPTGNLDEENAEIVLNIFRKLAPKGISTVMVTHDMEIAKTCSRRYIVKAGEISDA